MKKILFLSHSASRTGAPLLLRDIAKLLDKEKYSPAFILGEPGPLEEEFRNIGPVNIDALYPDELKYWREFKRVNHRIRLLKKIKPDLIYSNTIHNAKWLLYARLLGIPVVTHIHELSMGFSTLTPAEHWLIKYFSGTIIAVSDSVKNYLVEEHRLNAPSIHVVKAGIVADKFSSASSQRTDARHSLGLENSIVIGTVGRITPMKGSDLFLQVAAKLKQMSYPGQPYKFLMVGSQENPDYYALFMADREKLGLQNDVIVIENVTDVSQYYAAMDMYLSTAREDPFPLVVLEAMASGLPVVGFAVGGIPEAVTPECGILIPDINTDTIAEEINRLAFMPEKCISMGRAGSNRVCEQFSLTKNVQQIEHLIDDIFNQ